MASVFSRARELAKAGPVGEPSKAALAVAEEMETLTTYERLAKELGVSTDAVEVEKFKAFLSEKGLYAYDHAEVHAYLEGIYGPWNPKEERTTWGWRPLRDADKVTGTTRYRNQPNGEICDEANITRYTKPVPLPVLLTVKDVATSFPAARFYVSDEMKDLPEPVKDPFLLVRLHGKNFIIERWSEPGFGARKDAK